MKILNSLLLVFCLLCLACSPRDTDPLTKEDHDFKANVKKNNSGNSSTVRPLNSRPYLSKNPEFEFSNYILEKQANVLSLIPLAQRLASENQSSTRWNCYSIDSLESNETTMVYSIITEMCPLSFYLPTLDAKGNKQKLGTLDLSGNMTMKLSLLNGKVARVEVKSEDKDSLLSPKIIMRKEAFKGGQAATLVDQIDLSAVIADDGSIFIENLSVATEVVVATDDKTEKGKMVLWVTNRPLAGIKEVVSENSNSKKFEYEITNNLMTRFVYDMEIVGGAHSNVSLNLDLHVDPIKQLVSKSCVINEGEVPYQVSVGSKVFEGSLLISEKEVARKAKSNSTAKQPSLELLPCGSKMQNSVDLLFLTKTARN